jgi:hypothetical protein
MSFNLNKAARTILYVACALVVLLSFSSVASAQSADDFKVNYFDNNGVSGAPGAIVHVVNPGSGALCADIYVWRADQELSECCSCSITVNQVFTFTVADATNNPGDANGVPTTGSIDIVADSSATCTATAPSPTATLRAWATHVNADSVSGGYDVTETESIDTTLSSGEQSSAASLCGFLLENGSGTGNCTNAICPGGVAPEVKSTGKRAIK